MIYKETFFARNILPKTVQFGQDWGAKFSSKFSSHVVKSRLFEKKFQIRVVYKKLFLFNFNEEMFKKQKSDRVVLLSITV